MLAPLAEHLLRHFFGGSVLPCHSVTAKRSRIYTPTSSTQNPVPHALSQTPRLYSQKSPMHPSLSRSSPLTFSQNRNRMHQLPLAQYISTTSFSLWTLAGPVVLEHLVLEMHRGASVASVTHRVARRLPHRHAATLLRPPPRFTHRPSSPTSSPLRVFFLPCSKERYKNNKTTKESPPLSLSLSRCGPPLGLSLA